MTLLELAERCEKATGPHRELDAAIAGFLSNSVESDDGDFWWGPHDEPPIRVPDFTASLDAAMTLAPGPDWAWALEVNEGSLTYSPLGRQMVSTVGMGDPMRNWTGEAASPALAFCAAALKARAAIECVPNTPEGDG